MSPTTQPEFRSASPRPWRDPRLGVAVLLGALLPLGFAPFEFWWLLPAVVAAQALTWIDLAPRRAYSVGFGFGAGAFLAGTYWLYHSIVIIGKVPLPLALVLMLGLVAIMALYYGGVAWAVTRFARGRVLPAVLVLPGAWVLFEWGRGWVLSGFPWLSLGYALPESIMAGYLPLVGVYGGTLALAAVGAASLGAVKFMKPLERALCVACAAVIMVTGFGLARVDWVTPGERSVSASIGQLGLDQRLKWTQEAFNETLNWYANFVAEERGADVLVMPEAAIPSVADRVTVYLDQLGATAGASGGTLLLGILRRDEQGVYNALGAFEGRERSWYDKRHLVPFGEFFPVPAFVREWMRLRDLPYSDIARGRANPEPLTAAGFPIATSICYEDAYPAEQLGFFPDAAFIVNVSNDGWFGDSIAPWQHLQIARTRSAESQRWQLRATNTGVTAIIDGRGRVVDQAPAFEPAVLRGTIETVAGHTPYTRLGNLPALALSLALIALGAALGRRG
ncbi:MAG: apolipoprotein N-acyltransferase [Pseudomonadota bacterium]